MTEQIIKMAAKLYECRESAKLIAKFNNRDYHEMLKDYNEIIRKVMSDMNLDVIPAILEISKTKTYNQQSGVTQVLFMAAAVEIMESSK